jgi:type II secretory pathway pseudopilin PulG
MEKNRAFSLIEVVLTVGIISALMASVLLIGIPEYNRYVIYSERQYLVDEILESRARSLASGGIFNVSTWTNGYCIQDLSGLCIDPIHNLPPNVMLTSTNFATSTKLIIAFSDLSENGLQAEINVDQYGFIE